MLKVEGLHARYGTIHALRGVTLEVKEGQVVCLIGANGAGKSSTLMAISGVLRPDSGRIIFRGEDLADA
ncbi:MAG: ATP-binding cassette domain-containing protein, partial [Candidatus Methylomirabilaceae bacterium]